MKNSDIIKILVGKLSSQIDYRMTDLDETYEQAKSNCKLNSVAGPAVWAELDIKYAK